MRRHIRKLNILAGFIIGIIAIQMSMQTAFTASPNTSAAAKIDHSASLALLSSVTVSMIAATSTNQPQAVILKWVVDDQWIPENGYNLYRKGPGDTTFKKIAGPIVESQNPGILKIKGFDGKERTLEISALAKQAKMKVAIPAEMAHMFKPRPAPVEASTQIFNEMQAMKQQQVAAFKGQTRVGFGRVNIDQYPKLNTFMKRFQMKNANIPLSESAKTNIAADNTKPAQVKSLKVNGNNLKTGVKAVSNIVAKMERAPKLDTSKISQAQLVMNARTQLVMASLLNPTVNNALGMGYVDSNVKSGETYEYQLRIIKSDKTESSTPSASCTITVGADPLPAVPTGLQAQQLSLNSTGLRWNLDETKSSARVIAYRIYRTFNGQRQLLNDQALLVGPVQDSDGNYADPVIYFTDVNAKPGQLKYEVVGFDAFNRQTASALLDFTMADWETPLPVKEIGSVVSGSGVFLYWGSSLKTASAVKDDMAFYNVYRADTEDNTNKEMGDVNGKKVYMVKNILTWTKLNADPIKPAYTPAPKSISRRKASAITAKLTSLCFTDKTALKDHNYRYCVTALYQKNNMESAPSSEELVPVPDLDQPAPVLQVEGKCTPLYMPNPTFAFEPGWVKSYKTTAVPAARVRNLRVDPSTLIGATSEKANISGLVRNNNSTISSKYASKIIAATIDNSDLGSRVVLTWKPSTLTAPVKYKIYRSNASGYLISKNTAKSDKNDYQGSSIPSIGMSAVQSNTSSGTSAKVGTGVSITGASKKSISIIGNRSINYVQRIDPGMLLNRDYKLIAETSSPSYVDPLPKSRPMYYAYRITAINRWGIEGKPADLMLRIPATVKPPTVQLASAVPNQDGGVTLIWKPLEDSDECKKYVLYRKPIDIIGLIQKFQPIGYSIIQSKNDEKPSKLPETAFGVAGSVIRSSSAQNNAAKILGSNAVISQGVLDKASNMGLKTRLSLPLQNADFRKNLRLAMANTDYQSVGEITTFTVDSSGYIRYSDTKNVAANDWYSYTIRAVDADSWTSDAGKPVISTVWKVKAPAVSNLKASTDASKRGILLQWTAPPGDIMGYVVQKAVGDGIEFIQISGTLKDLKYIDFSALENRKSIYRVLAIDAIGNLSDPVTIDYVLPKYTGVSGGVTIKKPNDMKVKLNPGILK